MHTHEQYGHELGAQMRREVEVIHATPDLIGTLRRRQARRSWANRAAIAAPVAVAAAAAVLVGTAGQGVPDRGGQPEAASSTTGPARLRDVAYVQAQTVKALNRASQYVIYAKSTYSGGYYEEWIDKATQRYRNDVYTPREPAEPMPNGKAPVAPPTSAVKLGPIHLDQSHSVSGPEGDQTIVMIDYDLRVWSTDHMTDTRPPSAAPDITDPAGIREAISDGTLQLLDNETVAGHDTLHLRLYGPRRSYRIDMWVDVTTYLPVQATAAKSSGETGAREFPAAHTITTTYSWLPRTEANLAFLVLTPPPGFKQV